MLRDNKELNVLFLLNLHSVELDCQRILVVLLQLCCFRKVVGGMLRESRYQEGCLSDQLGITKWLGKRLYNDLPNYIFCKFAQISISLSTK